MKAKFKSEADKFLEDLMWLKFRKGSVSFRATLDGDKEGEKAMVLTDAKPASSPSERLK